MNSQEQLRPWLRYKRSGGANYLFTVLQTYAVLALLVYFISALFFSRPIQASTNSATLSASFPTATPVVTFIYAIPFIPAETQVVLTPTLMPVATPTEFNSGYIYNAAYSYYDPALGGVNCHVDNWQNGKCVDTTASGMPYSQYYGKGVAFPPEWLTVVGYGTVIRVIEPSVIAGEYTVIDMCPGCSGQYWPDRVFRVDFLDTTQRLPWAYPIKFKIIHFVEPVPR